MKKGAAQKEFYDPLMQASFILKDGRLAVTRIYMDGDETGSLIKANAFDGFAYYSDNGYTDEEFQDFYDRMMLLFPMNVVHEDFIASVVKDPSEWMESRRGDETGADRP